MEKKELKHVISRFEDVIKSCCLTNEEAMQAVMCLWLEVVGRTKGSLPMHDKKIWIKRTEPEITEENYRYLERHPEKSHRFTKLLIYYDKPVSRDQGGRIMTEAPSYMFPQIQPGEMVEFVYRCRV